jgi:short-subunit dehydrogenase
VERLNQLCQELKSAGHAVVAVAGDVTNPQVRQQLVSAAREQFGGLDCLINNAGLGGIGKFADNDSERLRRIMEVNFFAPLELIRLALPELRKGTRPLIVNVASVLGHCAIPKKSEYCASKFALHGFSDALRIELAEEQIDVMLLSPSTTQTEFFDVAMGDKQQLHWLSGGGQAPQAVAQAALRAMQRGKHEIILTLGGKIMVWLDRLCSTLMSSILRRYGQ